MLNSRSRSVCTGCYVLGKSDQSAELEHLLFVSSQGVAARTDGASSMFRTKVRSEIGMRLIAVADGPSHFGKRSRSGRRIYQLHRPGVLGSDSSPLARNRSSRCVCDKDSWPLWYFSLPDRRPSENALYILNKDRGATNEYSHLGVHGVVSSVVAAAVDCTILA